MRQLSRLAICCAAACASVPAQAQIAESPVAATKAETPIDASLSSATILPAEEWRKRTRVDLAAFADALRQNYIYAAYPDPARWGEWFNRTVATVEAELSLVHDEAGYRAVLTDLAAAFHDAHVSIRFDPSKPIPANWPGFLARFVGGTYRITASRQSNILDGAQVSACDGKPLSWWIATIARHEVGRPDTLETTRNEAALRLFIDRGSPLRARPA